MKKRISILVLTMVFSFNVRARGHQHELEGADDTSVAEKVDAHLSEVSTSALQVIQQLKKELEVFRGEESADSEARINSADIASDDTIAEDVYAEDQIEDHAGIFSSTENVEDESFYEPEGFDRSRRALSDRNSMTPDNQETDSEFERQEWRDQFLRMYYQIDLEREERRQEINGQLRGTSHQEKLEIEDLLEEIADYKRRRGSRILSAGKSCVSRGGRRCRVVQNLGVWRANNAQRCKPGRAKYSCHLVGKAVDFRVSKSCNMGRIGNCSRRSFGFFKNYGGGQIHIGPGSCAEARELPMPRACGGKKAKKTSKKKRKKKAKKRGKRSKKKSKKRRRRGRRR